MKADSGKNKAAQVTPLEKSLPKALSFYKDHDFIIQLKVRFIYYFCLSFIGILCIVLLYSASIQIASNPGGKLNWPILVSEASGLLVVILCLTVLAKGYYSIAAHLLLSMSLSITWIIMLVGNERDPIKTLDSVVFSLAVLSMAPLILAKGKRAIPLYFALNTATLFLYVLFVVPKLNISVSSSIDYFADTTVALVFMGIVSYNIFSIYKTSLDKISSENNDRKKAEAALRESENRFRQLFSQAPVPMAFIASDGTVLDVNQGITQALGYEKEDLTNIETCLAKIFSTGKDRDAYRKIWEEKIITTGQSGTKIAPEETRIICKDGSIIP